jgi:hypothetical protein
MEIEVYFRQKNIFSTLCSCTFPTLNQHYAAEISYLNLMHKFIPIK